MAASGLVIAPPTALVLGIVGVVGVALLAWAWWGPPAGDAVAPRRAAVVAAAPQRVAPEPPPRQASALPVMPAAPSAVSLNDLLAAPEAQLRTSLHAALAARAQGGRLYARALARRCADLAGLQMAAQPDVNDARHQRAATRQAALAAGCGQFANAEWLGFVNVAADEPGGDPLLAVQQSDLDDAALLQALFARPDALLLDELGERLLRRRIGGEAVLYFDGQRFDSEADAALAQGALRLLPCQFGLACDERDPEVWLACLRGDGCAGSRAEQHPAAAQALAARLAAALRGRELGRFLPPS
ncbi:hypothetical protein [Pelomonas aquatica]|uniref:hypothetical protein n=1 Tax=Pelomonas aquatica TaxID=431058 RepID=UPI00286BFF0C|nr:hypothetical protein [Pelomonas aquatica]